MQTDELSIGIDRRDNHVFIAQITHAAGRPVIEYLGETEHGGTDSTEPNPHIRRVYSVAERDAVVKHIHVGTDETYAPTQRAHFELMQSLLDTEQSFTVDIFPSHAHDRFIGVALRRTELPVVAAPESSTPYGFQVRGVALAKGFSAFCDHSHGEFHCLLDVTQTGVSIVFLYQGLPARIGYMGRPDSSNLESSFMALAQDIKTALSLHINTLFHEGITVPLAQVHISVDTADQPVIAAMRQYSHIELQVPILNQFSLNPNITISPDQQHRYLSALGLALE